MEDVAIAVVCSHYPTLASLALFRTYYLLVSVYSPFVMFIAPRLLEICSKRTFHSVWERKKISTQSECEMAEEIPRTLQGSKRPSSDLENQDPAEQNKRGKGPLLPPDSSLWICRNPACRATQTTAPRFCKRCSCCICGRFDNYTDPSLWLKCTPYSGPEFSCGFSCHIECALRHGRVGARTLHMQLDGCYSCPSCNKVSSIIGCWKKQLKIALGTNCIDVLCYRIFLSYRLLKGTTRFSELHKIVEDLKATIEMELGPINEATSKMTRAHSVRLCAANHVQALCKSAIKKAQELLPPNPTAALNVNVAEGLGSSYVLQTGADKPDSRFKSIWGRPRVTLDREKGSSSGAGTEKCIAQPETLQQEGLPLPDLNVGFQQPNAKPNTKLVVKRSGSGDLDDAFESIVRTICGLQHGGHVSKEFRLKFLTWFSLKATEHEHRVVRTFMKTMIDDPSGLAAQLVDTFSDMIFSSRP